MDSTMDPTQEIASTQDSNGLYSQSVDQIGFLAINGKKYPLHPGDYRIGRGPECNICLNSQTLSRMHAVINITGKKCVILDRESRNKTRVCSKTIAPFVPHPLKNGDTLQFGDVMGNIVLYNDIDIPMTQDIDMPETPIFTRSTLKPSLLTVPESPDESYQDESCNYKELQKVAANPNPFHKTILKSTSQHLDNNATIFNSVNKNPGINMNIYEMETQVPHPNNNAENEPEPDIDINSIYDAKTQLPPQESQLVPSLSIYDIDTQIPEETDLPDIHKINVQQEMRFEIYTSTKVENQGNINCKQATMENKKGNEQSVEGGKLNVSNSDEEILLDIDEIQDFYVCHSQSLLPEDYPNESSYANNVKNTSKLNSVNISQNCNVEKHCNDINLRKPIIPPNDDDDDLTDIEKDDETNHTSENKENELDIGEQVTQIIDLNPNKNTTCTFKTPTTPTSKSLNPKNDKEKSSSECEYLDDQYYTATQDIYNDLCSQKGLDFNLNKNTTSPFKTPTTVTSKSLNPKNDKVKSSSECEYLDNQYYNATQDIFNDLCSQKSLMAGPIKKIAEYSQEIVPNPCETKNNEECTVPSTLKISDRLPQTKNQPKVRGVVLKKNDSSDSEVTPKKPCPRNFIEVELPDSQEIKTTVIRKPISMVEDIGSESDENSDEQFTPILHRQTIRAKNKAKQDLSKKFTSDNLPTRVITRKRKPIIKVQLAIEEMKESLKSKFESNLVTEPYDNINMEIIKENTSRRNVKTIKKLVDSKMAPNSKSKTTENKSNNSKDVTSDEDKKIDKKRSANTVEPKMDNKKQTEKPIMVKKERTNKKNLSNKEIVSLPKDSKINNLEVNEHKPSTSRNNLKEHTKIKEETKRIVDTEDTKKKEDKTKAGGTRTTDDKVKKKEREAKLPVQETSKDSLRRSTRHKTHDKGINQHPQELVTPNQSRIYNISSSSDDGTTSVRKRMAIDENRLPSAKRTRTETIGSVNRSLRLTAARTLRMHHVALTMFGVEDGNVVAAKLKQLGAIIVSDINSCTVLITRQLKKSCKFLCAVGLGKPIVGPNWVQACIDNNKIVDPWQYLIKDEVIENNLKFNLSSTLMGSRNFLKGYSVWSTPSVPMIVSDMKLIVECSGGRWKRGGLRRLCISVVEDKHLWPRYQLQGALLVSQDLITVGVLRQQLDFNSYLLKK